MSESLKSKTTHGVAWSAIDNVARHGISFVVSVILARLLSPEEYGLIGILLIFIAIFNAVVDSGFTSALIRKPDVSDSDYSTVFITNFILSFVMAGVLFGCAHPISVFFENEELIPLTRVMSCVVIINALCLVQRVRLTKILDFKTQTKVSIISTIISGIVGIYMAYNGYGVWALVGQHISQQLITTLLFWIYSRWMPRMQFDKNSFWSMWSFGWKLLVSKLIDTTWQEAYQVVIGKVYAAQALGLYTRAKQFCDLFSSNLTMVVQKVSYPVLSSIQDDDQRLKSAYKRVIRVTMLITITLMLGMAATAKSMILFLIGDQWTPCVPMLQIICTYALFYPLHAINLNMLQVKGRSDLFLKLEVIKKIIAIIPLLFGIFIGIYWMLIGSFFANVASYYLNAYYSGTMLGYGIMEQIKDILPSFGVAIMMAIPVMVIGYLPLSPFILFPIQVILGGTIFIVICEAKKLPEYLELRDIVLPHLNIFLAKHNK